MVHNLYREQQLNADMDTVWSFFSSANNLSKITPPRIGFTGLTELDDEHIYDGMLIEYRIRPFWGFPLYWKTEIEDVHFQHCFTDVQRKGPYKLWRHLHTFVPNSTGVLMVDNVDYELPLGVLGNFVHTLFVRKKLQEIFDYRFRVLEHMFDGKTQKT